MLRLPACVLFDLDGTILDSLPGIEVSVRAAFVACGLNPPKVNLREIIGPPIRTILSRVGDIPEGRVLDALEKAFREDYDTRGWRTTTCFPEAPRVLRIMRERGHRLFVVSNKPQKVSLNILGDEQILDLFEAVVTRDSCIPAYAGKDDMIRSLMAERQIAPEDCIMVGDTAEDAKAAAAAGIGFVHMSHGYGAVESRDGSTTCSLDSFSQFLPLISEEFVCD